jgi:hypothetical protein
MLAMIAMRRIEATYGPHTGRASARDVRRALVASGAEAVARSTPLELQRQPETPPHLEAATPLEGDRVLVRRVDGDPIVGFAAFLDGVQRSEVAAHRGLVPLVAGSIAAAVRVRESRRMRTWESPIVRHAIYAPTAMLAPEYVVSLAARCDVIDTFRDDAHVTPGAPPRHPAELTARALTTVQRTREAAEHQLAREWIASARGPLLVDGGIAAEATVAVSAHAVGVVKSHRTLYVDGDSFARTLALRAGERTTAVAIASPRRTRVASFYLRLRDPESRGPFWGLVRIEIAADGPSALTERADLVSRWLLAERTPVALPDARWDVMVYGIRDCEEYLSAILR